MKKLELMNSIPENLELLEGLINPHIEPLLAERRKNKQKILETCQVGKFLMFFDNSLNIKALSESPDFILESSTGSIGLEHQIIVDSKAKEKEGFYENIFSVAEDEIRANPDMPNFLANCLLQPSVNFKINQKKYLVGLVRDIIKDYVLYNKFTENPLIESISIMPHSEISVNAISGAWWTKDITADLIESAIKKKEKRLSDYSKSNVKSIWLLMVIGGVGDSSYDMDATMHLDVKTNFDKVFVLEDFRSRLYEIK
jgi:hypothetical protein